MANSCIVDWSIARDLVDIETQYIHRRSDTPPFVIVSRLTGDGVAWTWYILATGNHQHIPELHEFKINCNCFVKVAIYVTFRFRFARMRTNGKRFMLPARCAFTYFLCTAKWEIIKQLNVWMPAFDIPQASVVWHIGVVFRWCAI